MCVGELARASVGNETVMNGEVMPHEACTSGYYSVHCAGTAPCPAVPNSTLIYCCLLSA